MRVMIDEHMQSLTDTLLNKLRSGTLCRCRHGPIRGHRSCRRAEDLGGRSLLREDPAACFDHITDICSADYPADQERFEVIYLYCHFLTVNAFASRPE